MVTNTTIDFVLNNIKTVCCNSFCTAKHSERLFQHESRLTTNEKIISNHLKNVLKIYFNNSS